MARSSLSSWVPVWALLSLYLLPALAIPGFDDIHAGRLKYCPIIPSLGPKDIDDTPAILKVVKSCSQNSVIEFLPGNFSLYTPVSFEKLKNVKIQLHGNILLPNDIGRIQVEINKTTNMPAVYGTTWIYFQGTDVQIIGSESRKFGGFYSFGQQWWDKGIRTLRPHLATFNVTNGVLKNLKVIKPIAWGWSVPGKNILIQNHFVDAQPNNATRDDTVSFPFNTDGFNFGGQNITLDGYYGHNGDDCVSIVHGAKDIVAKNGYCGFSSHGLSIGSLGRDGFESAVENVLFKNWTMDGAVYGARFKSWTGGRGYGKNIAWEDITLVNVSTGVFITQNYYDQDRGPKPPNPSNSSTRIIDLTFKNFKGSLGTSWTDGTCISTPCWNYVPGLDEPKAVILDLYPGTVSGVKLSNIDIHPAGKPGAIANVICDPSQVDDDTERALGFKCTNGPFEKA
ncbi:pectin lyase fold/virulence factor [Coprinopsis sp. MPI-PUGE-AT-0042]|nr:pectin lyase fold/virulence factor [Coprinopsis sp. MPI-PUGE-AT-0042]